MAINVTINEQQMKELMDRLVEIKNGVPKALSRAINKTATQTKTDMVFLAREDYNYKAAALRDRLDIIRATWSNLSAKTISTGGPIPLTDVTGTSWGGRSSPGVYVNVEKATGRKLIKSAWIGKGRHSGKELVYARTSNIGQRRRTEPPGRYPIRALAAPHPEIIYNQDKVWKSIQYLVDFGLEKNLNHEVDALVKGHVPSDEGL